MHTDNITADEFRTFLDDNFFHTASVEEEGEEPIKLEDGNYYGAIRDEIFRFVVKDGSIISLEEIQAESIPLADLNNPNSATDVLFDSWLSDRSAVLGARSWIIMFCMTTHNFDKLSEDDFRAIGHMFVTAHIPWNQYFVDIPVIGPGIKAQIAGCKFLLSAIKKGVSPWEFE